MTLHKNCIFIGSCSFLTTLNPALPVIDKCCFDEFLVWFAQLHGWNCVRNSRKLDTSIKHFLLDVLMLGCAYAYVCDGWNSNHTGLVAMVTSGCVLLTCVLRHTHMWTHW